MYMWERTVMGISVHTAETDLGSGDGADMGTTPLLQCLVTGHIIYRITIQENEVP